MDILDSLLGRGWNAARRRCWCEDGRIRAARALLIKSDPSTAPMRTSEFAIADRRVLSPLDHGDPIPLSPPCWCWCWWR